MMHMMHGSVHNDRYHVNLPRVCIGYVANAHHCISSTCGWDTNMKAGIVFQSGAWWLGVQLFFPMQNLDAIGIINWYLVRNTL